MKSMLSLCLICCQWQENFIQRKSRSTPWFFPETTEPIWFQSRVYNVSGRGSEAKNLDRRIPWQPLLQKNRSRRKQSTWFSKREVRADSAGQVQAGYSSLALLNLPSLGTVQPTAVLLIWRLLAFTEFEHPEQNWGEKNGMGSAVHHIWIPRYILHPKCSALSLPFKTVRQHAAPLELYFLLNQAGRHSGLLAQSPLSSTTSSLRCWKKNAVHSILPLLCMEEENPRAILYAATVDSPWSMRADTTSAFHSAAPKVEPFAFKFYQPILVFFCPKKSLANSHRIWHVAEYFFTFCFLQTFLHMLEWLVHLHFWIVNFFTFSLPTLTYLHIVLLGPYLHCLKQLDPRRLREN